MTESCCFDGIWLMSRKSAKMRSILKVYYRNVEPLLFQLWQRTWVCPGTKLNDKHLLSYAWSKLPTFPHYIFADSTGLLPMLQLMFSWLSLSEYTYLYSYRMSIRFQDNKYLWQDQLSNSNIVCFPLMSFSILNSSAAAWYGCCSASQSQFDDSLFLLLSLWPCE